MNISVVAAAVAITPQKQVRIALASVAATPIAAVRRRSFWRNTGWCEYDSAGGGTGARRDQANHRSSRQCGLQNSFIGVMVRRLLENLVKE